MCLLERREATIAPLNMTLAARLGPPTPLHNTCVAVGVPYNNWSVDVPCPNCRHELRVTVAPGGKVAPSPHWCSTTSPWYSPITTQCTVQPVYLPQSPLCSPLPPLVPAQCNEELRRLADTLRALRLSGWYYGNLDWQGARNLLKEASVGTFIIRDSGDRNFIFSLSVQTSKGPTSVRLHYEQGYFRLDCERPLARYMPRFRCVISLVSHYYSLGAAGGAEVSRGTVWVDGAGCAHSAVRLAAPRRRAVPSLRHAARLAVHRALEHDALRPRLPCAPQHRLLPLPAVLIDYLGEYPYSI